MLKKDSIDFTIEAIRRERINRRKIPEQVNRILPEIKAREPSSDSPFFRLAIIGYEIGKTFASLEHAIVYAERFKDDEKS